MSRTVTRLFVDSELVHHELTLEERLAHYATHVLRLVVGNDVVVFNGRGTERRGTIDRLTRRECRLRLHESLPSIPRTQSSITLVQGLIKPDRMDLIVQKATELGIERIVAAKTDFGAVKLDADRAERKLGHWQRIAESACEQSGRHTPPEIAWYRSLGDALASRPEREKKIAFHNDTAIDTALPDLVVDSVALVVGPEGGFSPPELELLQERAHLARLGPRTLRAETAAIVACSLAQRLWGDLS